MFLILVVFVALLLINQGEIRIYVFIALLAGVFVYYRYLWQRMTRPLSHTARATVAAYATILGWGQRPWGWLKTYIKSRKKETPPPDASE
jgi:Ca2+/Na+ antiporter